MSARKIEIERNIIERFLMRVKDYFKIRKRMLIYTSISTIIIIGLVISGIVYYKNREQRELEEFERIIDQYYSYEEKDLEKNFQKTIDDLNTLVDNSLWGYVNENGYYIIAGIFLSANKYDKGKEYLLKFVEKSPTSFFASLALHRAGIICEKLNDINGAFSIYQQLENEYQDCVIADEIYYDLGRIYHLKGDLLKAKEYYNKVISEFPLSTFSLKAKKRLLLLGYHSEKNNIKGSTM